VNWQQFSFQLATPAFFAVDSNSQGNDAVSYFLVMEKALFHALKPWNPSVRAVIAHFLHLPLRTEEEEVFLLLTIRQLTE